MAQILEFRRLIPTIYLSSNKYDVAALRNAEQEAHKLGDSAKLYREDLGQCDLFRKLLWQDRCRIISLKVVIFRPGTTSAKEALFREYGSVQDLRA